MTARRGERVNGAFERIEGVRVAIHRHGEGLVVIVAANLALRHFNLTFGSPGGTARFGPEK
ncbi:MAG TPA: hypothetical protein VF042_00655 [Gemmatimonadaceae bacterium]